MNGKHLFLLAGLALTGFLSDIAGANLIQNPSFETTPCVTPCNQDQGVMPSNWLTLNVTPDTYSNDGSYGLPPDGFSNFTGATAQDGIRWVAGWSAAVEIFGQQLASPLIPGREYTLSAYLREAVRPDLAHPGTYQIELWDSADISSANKIIVGSFQPLIDNQNAWELRTLTFIAPLGADTHPILAFRPLGSGAEAAYPGIDNVVLVESTIGLVINIKPDDSSNTVNPRARGKISVAILTTDTFDANTVDATTVRFGATGTEAAPLAIRLRDVNGDGHTDMVLTFNIEETGIQCGDAAATLTGKTVGGLAIGGSDFINTMGCNKK